MSYSNTGRHSYPNDHDANAYELHQTHRGGYIRTEDQDQDDQDNVPIHSRRQSRLGIMSASQMNSYTSYDDGYALAPHTRQSSYGAGYTDTPPSHERYDNPFEQPPAPQQQPEFDIMADFNNAGPRYSNVYGIAPDEKLAKPYRPKSKMGNSILSDDQQQQGEEAYRDSPIERSYSTRHSTKQGSRGGKSRAKPLLADANWDTSRHDVVREDEEGDERWGGENSGRGGEMGGKARFNTKAKDANGVELVTVPALGPE
ncbi:hypothetical protein QFC22_000227 [Naganishia vaughanmartiniae]|uniref:Uncharacterized protein n=1 Tax=Naganishia vaughanmartiniae TaxID=1424756 RepID=A0ACC2XMR7_9TREE|nr:hypothetical protein QFC22_000227 [Naganishia vaughanmartiniae]